MRTHIKYIISAFVLVAIIFLATLSSADTGKDPIKIGSILILSGDGASWGVAAKHGMELAIEEINESGGVLGRELLAIHEDDKGSGAEAVKAFQKLTTQDEVSFIIGTSWSSTGLPLVDLAKESKTIMISPSLGMKEFNEASKYLFNTWPHDFIATSQLAEFLFEKGIRKVAILGNSDVWVKEQTTTFEKRFTELGGKVVLIEESSTTTTDLSTEITKIKESGAEAVILTSGCMDTGPIAAKKFKELKIDLPIFSMAIDQQKIDASKGAYDGMVFFTFFTPSEEFAEKFRKRFGKEAEISSDTAYDAVMMIAQAIEKAGSTDVELVQKHLASITTYEGASGTLTSDKEGGFIKQAKIKLVEEGKVIDFQ
jgi:branched-chain amino acid transport system substrate-binding protein